MGIKQGKWQGRLNAAETSGMRLNAWHTDEVGFLSEVLEHRRQAVGAVLGRSAAGLPQRVLQTHGQRGEALPTFDHLDMFLVRERQHKVVQDVRERLAGHRDAHLVQCSRPLN